MQASQLLVAGTHRRLTFAACVVTLSVAACGGSSSSFSPSVPGGQTSSPSASAGSSPSTSATALPSTVASPVPANVQLQLSATWQGTLGAGPPTVHMQLYLTNSGAAGLAQVRIQLISNGQEVPIYNQDDLTNCLLDNQNPAQADLNYLDAGNKALCEPVYKSGQLGFSPFRFLVYASGYTQPVAQTRDYVCSGTNYNNGETCAPA